MSFALGALVASLLALLLLPTLNRRAKRLAHRRLVSLLPMSLEQVAAERDAMRADFAVRQRRLERKVEDAQAGRQSDMAAVGARTMEIAELGRKIEARDADLAARRIEVEEAHSRIAGLDRDLAASRIETSSSLAALTALEDAHRERLLDLKATRRDRDAMRRDLQSMVEATGEAGVPAADASGEASGAARPVGAAAIAALKAERDEAVAERDTLRARLAEAQAAQANVGEDDAELRRRIVDVADAVARRERLAGNAFPRAASS